MARSSFSMSLAAIAIPWDSAVPRTSLRLVSLYSDRDTWSWASQRSNPRWSGRPPASEATAGQVGVAGEISNSRDKDSKFLTIQHRQGQMAFDGVDYLLNVNRLGEE